MVCTLNDLWCPWSNTNGMIWAQQQYFIVVNKIMSVYMLTNFKHAGILCHNLWQNEFSTFCVPNRSYTLNLTIMYEWIDFKMANHWFYYKYLQEIKHFNRLHNSYISSHLVSGWVRGFVLTCCTFLSFHFVLWLNACYFSGFGFGFCIRICHAMSIIYLIVKNSSFLWTILSNDVLFIYKYIWVRSRRCVCLVIFLSRLIAKNAPPWFDIYIYIYYACLMYVAHDLIKPLDTNHAICVVCFKVVDIAASSKPRPIMTSWHINAFLHYWLFVKGIRRSLVIPLTKRQLYGLWWDVLLAEASGGTNSRECRCLETTLPSCDVMYRHAHGSSTGCMSLYCVDVQQWAMWIIQGSLCVCAQPVRGDVTT